MRLSTAHIRKHRRSGDLYEIDNIVHPREGYELEGDVVSGHRLSAYDGMPIGPRVWLKESEFVDLSKPAQS